MPPAPPSFIASFDSQSLLVDAADLALEDETRKVQDVQAANAFFQAEVVRHALKARNTTAKRVAFGDTTVLEATTAHQRSLDAPGTLPYLPDLRISDLVTLPPTYSCSIFC